MLSERLGGRREVVEAPAVELFKFMEMALEERQQEAEQERARMFIQYLSNIFSQPMQEKPSPKFLRAKREFEQLLSGEAEQQPKKPAKVYEWDFEREKRLAAAKGAENLNGDDPRIKS